MAWEQFPGPRRSYRAQISVRTNGQIGFSTGAVTRYNLKDMRYVLFFWDGERQRIGIKPVQTKEPGTCCFVHRVGDAFVSAKSFFDFFSISRPTLTMRYALAWSDEEQMLVIEYRREG